MNKLAGWLVGVAVVGSLAVVMVVMALAMLSQGDLAASLQPAVEVQAAGDSAPQLLEARRTISPTNSLEARRTISPTNSLEARRTISPTLTLSVFASTSSPVAVVKHIDKSSPTL